MGSFVFAQYTGSDAGRVLVAMLTDSEEGGQIVEVESETEVRKISVGFQPNDPEPELDPEGDPDDPDD